MASIRTRLTAWNAGVLALIVCVLLGAAYAFLRYASLTQINRSLLQEKDLVAATIAAHAGQPGDRAALVAALIGDLRTHGLDVLESPGPSNTIVTIPVTLDDDDPPSSADGPRPLTIVDWRDLAAKLAAQGDDDRAFNIRAERGQLRALAWRASLDSRPFTFVVSEHFHDTAELLETARDAALLALPVALLIAVLSGYLLARRALGPVAAMTAEARRIGARNVHERLSIRDPDDELGQLALAFNDVLARVDAALEQQRRFTADASHELRTPVALIRTEAEVALSSTDTAGGEYRAALEATRDSSRQLSRIVEDLFLLARADAGQTVVVAQRMRLDEMIRSTLQGLQPLAVAKGIALDAPRLPIVVYDGDPELLRRALTNLVDNAIKYMRGPGRVEVRLEAAQGEYVITVSDNGPGISASDVPHLFERFFRGDSSRPHHETVNSAGAGLGLAIARDIAELHGGSVTLASSTEAGSIFEIHLPANRPGDVLPPEGSSSS
ncbi:MAG: HAMP domain-containing histidine kinase [Gemmatimonadota bacterium]|nr:HAMP domain-containing histidine kinase [Gemmatimonadota bacterium]